MNVLIVDDDLELADLLADYLGKDGFEVMLARDGEQGLEVLERAQPAVVVLDSMLPGLDGIEVLKHIRRRTRTPVLMLSARGDDGDRIAGLELGADDYVRKPCTPRELAARLRAIARRGPASAPAGDEAEVVGAEVLFAIGALAMWPAQRRLELAGSRIELTGTEFDLLKLLMSHPGRPVSKAELSSRVLGRPLATFDRSIDVHMSSIRHKIGPLADGRSRIQAVVRKGYQLIAD